MLYKKHFLMILYNIYFNIIFLLLLQIQKLLQILKLLQLVMAMVMTMAMVMAMAMMSFKLLIICYMIIS